MNRAEYLWYSSEIETLEALLHDIPEENVIERMGFESRLKEARAAVKGVIMPASHRLKLTFRGQPVIDTYGIYADFASQALDKFTNAVAAIVASLKEKLSNRGRIPEKQQNQLLFVGTAIGSFGFELELPASDENKLFEEFHVSGESVKKIQAIFQAITEGTDEDLAEFIDEVHPRAIDKVHEFLEYQIQRGAWCGLDFDGHVFRFQNEEQLKTSARRLAKDNIIEEDVDFTGTLLGVLPFDRRFELETTKGDITKGRTELTFEEGKELLKYITSTIKIKLRKRQVGRGNPRYILESLGNVVLADSINS
jgi:hypothetical protein